MWGPQQRMGRRDAEMEREIDRGEEKDRKGRGRKEWKVKDRRVEERRRRDRNLIKDFKKRERERSQNRKIGQKGKTRKIA